MKRDVWDKFFGMVRGVEAEIVEGRTKPEDWAKARPLAEHLSQEAKGHRFRSGSNLCSHLCDFVVLASTYHELCSEMGAKGWSNFRSSPCGIRRAPGLPTTNCQR